MAVLESSLDHKSRKQPSNRKKSKSTLLLAQDLSYARNLAANEEKVRRRCLKYLKKYLEQRTKASPLTEESLKILWKGLFYSMWMSDKPLVQEECAENIAQLIHYLQFNDAMHFFKIGLITLQNEWVGIDQLRLDKFLMFVRRLLRQALCVLKKCNFKKDPNQVFAKILEDTILSTTDTTVPLGLAMHFTEIYLEELAKVSDGKLQPSRTIDFLKPYIYKLAFASDNRIIQWINKFIFTHLMRQHKLGLEYEDKYKIWKSQSFAGSIDQIQKVRVSYADIEQNNHDESDSSSGNKPLDPRAGRVDVELPQILFSAKEISDELLMHKTDQRTSKNTRNQLTVWADRFLKLHNGTYPLGIKKLEQKKRKTPHYDTNIDKAAKRLIKFEQKLMARDIQGKKRKREDSENQDEEISNIVVKKTKKDSSTPAQIELEESNDKKEKRKEKSVKKPSFKSLEPSIDMTLSEKHKIKRKTVTEKKDILKKKIKKKKLKVIDQFEGINTSIDDYNFCFKRNSGIWVVTPEFGFGNEPSAPSPAINKNNLAEENSESEIFIPSAKFVKKLKKTKSAQEVEQVLNKLRGKSMTSRDNLTLKQPDNEASLKKHKFISGSPKKVVINTKLNSSQDIFDHIVQVKSSPQIPWDSSKKPGKPLLKTPVKPSPINPFYKLGKF